MTQHSSFITQQSSWALRLLLAALLAFASEILLWTTPPARSLLDWALLAAGYVALAALLLEIAARYRLRDVFGLLTLAGIYGMANGLILNPQSALIDVPRTLVTRAMGAHAFAGLLALALFLGLMGGGLKARRSLVIALVLALVVGIGWAAWARWSPAVFSTGEASTPETLALYGAPGLGLVALALVAARRYAASPDLRLDRAGWGFTLLVLAALLLIHLLRGEVDPLSLTVIVTLMAFSLMIIWFQKRKKGATLLDNLSGERFTWAAPALLIAAFALAAAVGYNLPRGSDANDPIALISALFTAYGLIWLPAVSLVLGARAFVRQARAMQL